MPATAFDRLAAISDGLFAVALTFLVRDLHVPSAERIHNAIAALLCIINTYWSIAFIFLLQLNYALAPRIRLLEKI